MESSAQIKNHITEGTIWKQLLLFFFPILLGTFFQQLYNTIDSVIVGFFTGLSSGASVTVAQFFGARNVKAANEGLHNAYAMAVAGGIGLYPERWSFS